MNNQEEVWKEPKSVKKPKLVYKTDEERKEAVKISNAKYRAKNLEKISAQQKVYKRNNKEKIDKVRKEHYKNNRPAYTKNSRLFAQRKLANNPLFRFSQKISHRIGFCFKRKDIKKATKTVEVLGCSIQEFRLHIESKFEPWMNWDNHGLYNGDFNYGWDLDHIIPARTAKTEEEVLQLNHYSNFQPLCSRVNRYVKR